MHTARRGLSTLQSRSIFTTTHRFGSSSISALNSNSALCYSSLSQTESPPSQNIDDAVARLEKIAGALKAKQSQSTEVKPSKEKPKSSKSQTQSIFFLGLTLGIVGALGLGWYLSPNQDQHSLPEPESKDQQQLPSRIVPGLLTFNALHAERIRLTEKYNGSWSGYWILSWLSQGYAHWLKLEALLQLEKELNPALPGGISCFSEATEKKLKEAYSFYPETEDKKFADQYLKESGRIGEFKRCEL